MFIPTYIQESQAEEENRYREERTINTGRTIDTGRGWHQAQKYSSQLWEFLPAKMMTPQTIYVAKYHACLLLSFNNIYSTFCFCLFFSSFVDHLGLMHFNLQRTYKLNIGSDDYATGNTWSKDIFPLSFSVQTFWTHLVYLCELI